MTSLRIDEREARLLGVLIEKELTTPDAYPLSLNALRMGANQKSNRDPDVDYTEAEVEESAVALVAKGLVERVSGARVERWRHLAASQLGLGREALAVLAEFLLRGPQAPGELRTRASRMAPMETLYDLGLVLADLDKRGLARRLPPSPGSRVERWRERLTWGTQVTLAADAPARPRTPEEVLAQHDARAAERAAAPAATAPAARAPAATGPAASSFASANAPTSLSERVGALEARVAALEQTLRDLAGD